jgi:hypothetical protein
MAQPGSSRHVLANHYIPADFDGTQDDRRGGLPGGSAGNAQQYDNWARGGIGRFSLAGALGTQSQPALLGRFTRRDRGPNRWPPPPLPGAEPPPTSDERPTTLDFGVLRDVRAVCLITS